MKTLKHRSMSYGPTPDFSRLHTHVNLSFVFTPITGLRITWNLKLEDYKVTRRNSWYFVLLVVTLHLWDRICKMFPVLRDGDPLRYRCLRQELRDLKLHKDNKGCGEVWTLDWRIHPFSVDNKDHEHEKTVYECKYHHITSGTTLINTVRSRRVVDMVITNKSEGHFHRSPHRSPESQVRKHIFLHTKSSSYQDVYHEEVTVCHLKFLVVDQGDDWNLTCFLSRSSITFCIDPPPFQRESEVNVHRLPNLTQ